LDGRAFFRRANGKTKDPELECKFGGRCAVTVQGPISQNSISAGNLFG
jgi:hypothetical protein